MIVKIFDGLDENDELREEAELDVLDAEEALIVIEEKIKKIRAQIQALES